MSSRLLRHFVSWPARGLVASSAIAALACSGGDPGSGSGPTREISAPSDAGSSASDAGSSGNRPSTDAGGADTGSPVVAPPGFVSNVPGATLVDVSAPPIPDLALLSANFLQKPSGSQVFAQWLGEVKNVGTTTRCYVTLSLTYKSASGAILATTSKVYTDADPYSMTGSSVTTPCLAPGKTAGFYQNGFEAAQVSLGLVSTIEVALGSDQYPTAAPAAHTPVATAQVTPIFNGYGLKGTLTGGAGPVYNIGYRMYPRDAAGLVLGQLVATDLDTLSPGGTFPFSTTSVDGAFTEYRGFLQFIDGPKPPGGLVPQVASAPPITSAVAIANDARHAQQEGTAARARAAQER